MTSEWQVDGTLAPCSPDFKKKNDDVEIDSSLNRIIAIYPRKMKMMKKNNEAVLEHLDEIKLIFLL